MSWATSSKPSENTLSAFSPTLFAIVAPFPSMLNLLAALSKVIPLDFVLASSCLNLELFLRADLFPLENTLPHSIRLVNVNNAVLYPKTKFPALLESSSILFKESVYKLFNKGLDRKTYIYVF